MYLFIYKNATTFPAQDLNKPVTYNKGALFNIWSITSNTNGILSIDFCNINLHLKKINKIDNATANIAMVLKKNYKHIGHFINNMAINFQNKKMSISQITEQSHFWPFYQGSRCFWSRSNGEILL